MDTTVCNFNKFSHCKYGKNCNFRHVDKKCGILGCKGRGCDLRHPKYCRYIVNGKVCKFSAFCSFEHNVNCGVLPVNQASQLRKQIDELKNQIDMKDLEIEQLTETIRVMEQKNPSHVEFFNDSISTASDTTTSEIVDLVEEATTVFSENEPEEVEENYVEYQCNYCDFKTKKRHGLSIHIGKLHKYSCNHCDEVYTNDTDLKDHIQDKHEASNISNLTSYSRMWGDIKIDKLFGEENCLGVFAVNFTHPEGPGIPLVYLHHPECWLGAGQYCTDRPVINPVELVVIDHELEIPTVHVNQNTTMNLSKSTVDWENISTILQKHTTFETWK